MTRIAIVVVCVVGTTLLLALRFISPAKLGIGSMQHTVTIFVEAIKGPMNSFRADVGRYPTNEEGLHALLQSPPAASSRWRGAYLASWRVPRSVEPALSLSVSRHKKFRGL